MSNYKKLFKQSINLNIPIKFSYWSNTSPYFPDAESPPHDRIVQPVVFGEKIWSADKSGLYFRGYLLSQYSFSKNKYFDNELTNRARNPRYWRLYNLGKMRNVTLVPDFPKEKRFYPKKHKEYNPNDTFFSRIYYAMPSNYSYSYYFTGKEESVANQQLLFRIRLLMEKRGLTLFKPLQLYEISQNEEVGFVDSKFIWINSIWANLMNETNFEKGLIRLISTGRERV